MEVENVLVTGANRGIGLEFVRQLVNFPKPPRNVFAAYRNKDTLQALENIEKTSKQSKVLLVKMDVTKIEDIKNAAKLIAEIVGERGLNLLINNAGAAKFAAFPELTEENMLFAFKTNAVGPVMVLQKMLPLLQRAALLHEGSRMNVSRSAVVNISSAFGSISESANQPREWLCSIGYAVSKAALNMAMRMASPVAKDKGILVVNMCPGWVKTDMGTENGELTPFESVSAMLNTLSRLDESHQGSFINRNGVVIPF